MMDKFVKLISEAHKHALEEGIKAAKSGTVIKCSEYLGRLKAYEYVLKELNRLLGVKVKKW